VAASTEQVLYPRGRIALDTGDLIDVTDVKLDFTNNAKQVNTLRRPGAGYTIGNRETTVTFNVAVSEEGLERDYFLMAQRGLIKQLRLKVPGKTINVEGVFKDVGLELPLDAEIKQSLTFIGKMGD
jgi:hypothetical protein